MSALPAGLPVEVNRDQLEPQELKFQMGARYHGCWEPNPGLLKRQVLSTVWVMSPAPRMSLLIEDMLPLFHLTDFYHKFAFGFELKFFFLNLNERLIYNHKQSACLCNVNISSFRIISVIFALRGGLLWVLLYRGYNFPMVLYMYSEDGTRKMMFLWLAEQRVLNVILHATYLLQVLQRWRSLRCLYTLSCFSICFQLCTSYYDEQYEWISTMLFIPYHNGSL